MITVPFLVSMLKLVEGRVLSIKQLPVMLERVIVNHSREGHWRLLVVTFDARSLPLVGFGVRVQGMPIVLPRGGRLLTTIKAADPHRGAGVARGRGGEGSGNIPLFAQCGVPSRFSDDKLRGIVPSQPLVSVIMPFRDEERWIVSAVTSLLRQSCPDFELIAIDDKSTDDSVDLLRQLSDPRVTVVQGEGKGIVAALNLGISRAQGMFLARMDADDLSHQRRLERQLALFDADSDVVIVGVGYEVIDPNGKMRATVMPPASDFGLRRRLLVTTPYAHGSIMWRRGLDYRYRQEVEYAEDYDLIQRLSDVGKLASVPEVLYSWRVRPGNMSVDRAQQKGVVVRAVRDEVWRKALAGARSYERYGDMSGETPRARGVTVVTELKIVNEAVHRRQARSAWRAARLITLMPADNWLMFFRFLPERMVARSLRRTNASQAERQAETEATRPMVAIRERAIAGLRRVVKKKYRHAIHNWLLDTPTRMRCYLFVRRPLRVWSVDSNTAIVIEGFPRSANSYALAAFQFANGTGPSVAHHLHSAASVEIGAAKGKPVLVLVRSPVDAVASELIHFPGTSARNALVRYERFYRRAAALADSIVVVPFDIAVKNFGRALEAVNARFGTSFAEYSPSEENEAQVMAIVDEMDARQTSSGVPRENSVARPSEYRRTLKAQALSEVEKYPEHLQRAMESYEAMLRIAISREGLA